MMVVNELMYRMILDFAFRSASLFFFSLNIGISEIRVTYFLLTVGNRIFRLSSTKISIKILVLTINEK